MAMRGRKNEGMPLNLSRKEAVKAYGFMDG
jgi:hypothetical protein